MSKAARFARRVDVHGQTVSLETFSAYATGDYVDSDWNAPDPEDDDYPASGSVPGVSYADAVSVKAMFQPLTSKEAERVINTPWGELVTTNAKAYFKGSRAITHRDRITYDSRAYWVAGIEEQWEGDTAVYRLAYLVETVT